MGAARAVGAKGVGGGGSGTRVLGVVVGGWPGEREGENVCTARMRWLLYSATYRARPSGDTTTPIGKAKLAAVPVPSA